MQSLLGWGAIIAGAGWYAWTWLKPKPFFVPEPLSPNWRVKAATLLDELIDLFESQNLDASSLRAAGRQLYADREEVTS